MNWIEFWKGFQAIQGLKIKTGKENRKINLVSRSNQDGTSKSNTAPQLTGIIIIDRSSKEHPQNKVNQKELPQLNKYFRSFI